MSINITGIDKVKLLKALWENQIVAAFFIYNNISPPDFDENEAVEAVKRYIDYFCGRAIKTDLSKDVINPYMYDRDAGVGKFQKVVNTLINNNNI